ncbi:MAG: thiamine kinase-like enzyme [Psychromonas sp.]|uniref:phosphotransferase n=1 Tax=Psychromonas sp. TaxID=1884585 RepID=UPI0039E67A67
MSLLTYKEFIGKELTDEELACNGSTGKALTDKELIWIGAQQSEPIVVIEPLEQALTNAVFLLTLANNEKIIFKRLNLSARNESDRRREFKVDQLAIFVGLTPKAIACCGSYKLQEYFTGKELSRLSVNKEIINLLAVQLKKIHHLPALHAQPQSLTSTLTQLKKTITSAIDEQQFSVILKRAIILDNSSAKNVLCHGDLSLHNLLINNKQQVMILDWEYATLACPAYDLASCICINRLDNLQQESLIASYYSLNKAQLTISLSALRRECQLYFSVFSYLNGLWMSCFAVNNK